MNLIDIGIEKKVIRFDEDKNFVYYVHQNKKRNFNNPEEKVQLESFLTLILVYGYPVERVKNYVNVQMGAETKEADIIIYADDECESTYIVVECKKETITDQEFNKAVDQAYSYAVAEGAKYVWISNRIKNEYYEVPEKKPKSRITIPDVPQFGVKKLAPYKYVKGGLAQPDIRKAEEPEIEYGAKQKFFELQVVSENELTRIFIQAHQSLWGGGQRKPDDAFDEFNKLIFCKLWDEKHPRKVGEPYEFQIFAEETPGDLATRVHGIYEQGKKKDTDKEVFKENIKLKEDEIQTIVKYLQRINLSKTDLDSKGRAFETFMGSHFRGDFGQFFTADRPDYPISILNDPEAAKYIDGSAFHLYGGVIENVSQVHEAHPNKNLYFTEQWIGAPGDFAGDFRWHIKNLIIGASRNWCKTVLEWNLAADPQQKPHTPGGCDRCLGAVTIDGDLVTRNPAYYIVAHASKFARPGSVRIDSNIPDELPNVAFKTPDGKVVVIVFNDSDSEKTFNLKVENDAFTTSLSAGSVGTYVW